MKALALFPYLLEKRLTIPTSPFFIYSPAAEVGNPALPDNVFFFTDSFSFGYMQQHPGRCGVLNLGQLRWLPQNGADL